MAATGAPATINEPSTMVAINVTAYVSNKSAAIPAQSPTLSPTLSAITAGLRGSSSGMPASTLPTKSAPTSAPLVKIPPPKRAKIEINEEPNAKPMRGCNTAERSCPAPMETRNIKNRPTPKSPRPTTNIPVIAPPLKATLRASFIPLVAASAVRTFARTDTFIPMKPHAPERTAPTTKPIAVAKSKKSAIRMVRITPTIAIVLYWRDK